MPSSTSNSDKHREPFRFPWALLMAVGILVVVEVLFRRVLFRNRVIYHAGAREYLLAAEQLKSPGPANVCFVGSSRARESIVVPEVKRLLEAHERQDTVANYALGGGQAQETYWAVRRLLAGKRKPDLILYGVSPRQFLGRGEHFSSAAFLWDLGDWYEQSSEHGMEAGKLLPKVIRNEIKQRYVTFAARDARKQILLRILGRDTDPCPIIGQLTPWQKLKPDVSLAVHPANEQDVRNYIATNTRRQRYADPTQVGYVKKTIRLCRDAGVPLVLFEVPVAEILRRCYPDGIYDHFYQTIAEFQQPGDLPFVPIAQLKPGLTDKHFREPSHTNYGGAVRFTRALTRQVILPRLRQGTSQPRGPTTGRTAAPTPR
jgi:hypothetical protein